MLAVALAVGFVAVVASTATIAMAVIAVVVIVMFMDRLRVIRRFQNPAVDSNQNQANPQNQKPQVENQSVANERQTQRQH